MTAGRLDGARAVGARVAAFVYETAHPRSGETAEAELCDGSGWPMRQGCTGTDGRVSCPLGSHRVSATPIRRGVVALDPHYPDRIAQGEKGR